MDLTPEISDETTAERIARRFHETYEQLAPSHGYETRRESAKPWAEVPEQNRRLMVATVLGLLPELRELGREAAYRAGREDAARAVLKIHSEVEGRCVECVEYCDCLEKVKELGDDYEVAATARMCDHGNVEWPCPTVQAINLGRSVGREQGDNPEEQR